MSDLIRPGVKGRGWGIPQDGVRYLVCRVRSGADWWDLDDRVGAIRGRRLLTAPTQAIWHAIPEGALGELEAIAESNPGRLVVHWAYVAA